jgi:hypothetical protein
MGLLRYPGKTRNRLVGQFGNDSQEAVMDAGLALKPAVNMANSHAQPAIASAPATPTDLPAAKSVRPAVNSEPARNERRPTTAGGRTTHDAIIDPQTREVVYRILDARTRQVLHQVPDQALLRMQAYSRAKAARALAEGQDPATAQQAVAQKVYALA